MYEGQSVRRLRVVRGGLEATAGKKRYALTISSSCNHHAHLIAACEVRGASSAAIFIPAGLTTIRESR